MDQLFLEETLKARYPHVLNMSNVKLAKCYVRKQRSNKRRASNGWRFGDQTVATAFESIMKKEIIKRIQARNN